MGLGVCVGLRMYEAVRLCLMLIKREIASCIKGKTPNLIFYIFWRL